ncbi:hypothetical protein GXY_04399 [Novacetimonas hansenii ATCC 23769]|uniref:Uncharacterized protein n=1 Tax=Novacetimonas hansenii ATCC 23769 TaxID=714995 RepID=D5QCM6_NOVHA|nr:hypothetical protein GXY_04399 [Novacetimonas hansenii ATCC 23769]PYD72404.1 hypothetical protein CFR74_09610 [Novacetimonas hansenii]
MPAYVRHPGAHDNVPYTAKGTQFAPWPASGGAKTVHCMTAAGSHQTQFCFLRGDLCRFMLEHNASEA